MFPFSHWGKTNLDPKIQGGFNTRVAYKGFDLSVVGAILTFLNEESLINIDYNNKNYDSNVGAGIIDGEASYVISPRGISRIVHPGLWKLGPYRTDNGSGLGQPNAGSTRPFNIAKFSELYLIAAEAAVKGATTKAGKSARELVNVLRARAGVWRWDNNGNTEKIQDYITCVLFHKTKWMQCK